MVFIALPIGAMLVRSLVVTKPAPLQELRQMTVQALDLLEPTEREQLVKRWVAKATQRQEMEAVAAALELHGQPVPWDRKAAYDHQIAAANTALQGLSPRIHAKVMAEIPTCLVMLHRRTPLAFMVKEQLGQDGFDALRIGKTTSYGLLHYLTVLNEERMRNAAANSLMLASTTTVVTTLMAFLIAFGINRGSILGAETARYGILIPLVSPPVIIATAAILLFGRNGLVTKELLEVQLGLIDASTTNLYGLSGVVLAQVLSFLAPAFIIFDNVLAKQDGRLEEAAAIQGANSWQVFWHTTLPMSLPGIIRAATLVFILSMTDFGNPLVIGKDMPVLAGVLYDEMIGFHNTPLASAIAVWLIVPALCIYAMLNRVGRRKRFETTEASPSELVLPPGVRWMLSLLTWSVIGFTAIIYSTIVVGSFVKVWGQDFSFTPHHYTAVEAMPNFVSEFVGVEPVWTSVLVAMIAAPLGGVFAVVVAYLAERFRGWIVEAISFTVLLPAVLPGVVFGIGYIVAFNNPFGFKSLSLNGTHAILVLNILFGNVFVGVLAGRAMLRRLDSSVDEAAEILGASLMQRFTRVTLPMMRRAALLGMLYVFVDGMCTFSAVVFLQGPDIDLVSVAIFQTASNSYYGAACAMSVSILLIVSAVMGLVKLFNRYGSFATSTTVPRVKEVAA